MFSGIAAKLIATKANWLRELLIRECSETKHSLPDPTWTKYHEQVAFRFGGHTFLAQFQAYEILEGSCNNRCFGSTFWRGCHSSRPKNLVKTSECNGFISNQSLPSRRLNSNHSNIGRCCLNKTGSFGTIFSLALFNKESSAHCRPIWNNRLHQIKMILSASLIHCIFQQQSTGVT